MGVDTEAAIDRANALLKKVRKGQFIDPKDVGKLAETTLTLATALQAARDKKPYSVNARPKADTQFLYLVTGILAFILLFALALYPFMYTSP